MKKSFCLFLIALSSISLQAREVNFMITNHSDIDRINEISETTLDIVTALCGSNSFIILNTEGEQVPYQITYDKKVIFPVTVNANQSIEYKVTDGTPETYSISAYGKHYPERLDDIAWENDKIAFRTYGPALQATGERAFGYDVWVKSIPGLVVENRYFQELTNGISYHTDHGNGLDYYSVGPTLGAGTSALLSGESIVYPYCYKTYEILDNGPLRFTVKLTYNPITIGDDLNVTETRVISLDIGSHLNKITVSFSNLSHNTSIATGIVLHERSDDYKTDVSKGYIAYADPADPENGQTFIGAVFPEKIIEAKPVYFSDEEKKERKANGHLLAISPYIPDTEYTYYAGAGWSKYGFPTSADWFKYIKDFSEKIRKKLILSIN